MNVSETGATIRFKTLISEVTITSNVIESPKVSYINDLGKRSENWLRLNKNSHYE